MQVLGAEQQSLRSNLADASSTAGQNRLSIIAEIQNLFKTAEAANNNNNIQANDNDKENVQLPEQTKSQCQSPAPSNSVALSDCHRPIHAHTPFPGISELLPGLYLCGAGVALPHILDQLGVRFVINVAPELPDTPLSNATKPLYLRIGVLDRPDVELAPHFDEVADMIEEVRQHGGKSLVHCVAGVSRSATLCIAYLMRHAAMNLRDAYLHVKAIRPQIRPNSGFFQQLRRYEEQLLGSSSVQMVYYASLDKEIPDVYEPEYRAMEEFYQRRRQALSSRR